MYKGYRENTGRENRRQGIAGIRTGADRRYTGGEHGTQVFYTDIGFQSQWWKEELGSLI